MKTKTLLMLIAILIASLLASNAYSQKEYKEQKTNGSNNQGRGGLGGQGPGGLGGQGRGGLGGQGPGLLGGLRGQGLGNGSEIQIDKYKLSQQDKAVVSQDKKSNSAGQARNVKPGNRTKNGGTNVFDGNIVTGSRFVRSNIQSGKDSVFYLNVTKRNGWPEGIGKPLRKEELSHIPLYYVLSNKNSAGKWTFMRAYNAYGKLTTNHSWGTYILNQNDEYDSGANADWTDRLKTVCQWEYIGNLTGTEVVQERALDKDKNVVFCYNIVKPTPNEKDGSAIYFGSYTDAFALPVYMRTDSMGNYKGHANFVQVKRDKRGYETHFAFTDETGQMRLNKDGAYQTSKDYDANGRQIREASLDLWGNQMIDYYGNCGWQNVADEYGNILKATYFDKDNEPIRMPGTRGSDKVFGYEFAYDKYHREQDRWYLDSLGKRDTNEYGVYHTISEYNKHGERTRYTHYDKEGNLIGGDEYGIAQAVTDYDEKGNLLLVEWRDKYGLPVNGYGDYCKSVMTYDTKGNPLSQFDYKKNERDSLVKTFEYKNDGNGNEIRNWYADGYCRIDSVDVKGRATLEAWYNLDNAPIAGPVEAWHKHITTYDDENNIIIEKWLDKDGDPYIKEDDLSNEYNLSITETDSVNHIITNTQYLKPLGLAQRFQKQFDDEDNIVAQWDVTPYGEHARVGWWNNLHYKCMVNYSMYGKMKDMIGVNEFDEPSYLVSLDNDGEVYHYSDMSTYTYYDENMQVIPSDSMATFKDILPKAFCIEVTDTTIAYPLGLRNGDIILSYGDWATSEDLRSNLNYFYLETILRNSTPKKITLLRHDISTKTSSIIEYELPEGKPSELGFYPHQICYTKKEADRLYDACQHYNFAYGRNEGNTGKQILMGVQLKGGLVRTRFYHFPFYDYKDPGFLLYASEKYSKGQDTWSVLYDDIATWQKNNMYDSRFPGETKLFLTQDMKTLKKLEKNGSGTRGLRIIPINVTDEVYNNLISYYNAISIKDKQVVGKWDTEIEIEKDKIYVSITLDLKNKHQANMIMTCRLEGEISSGIVLKLKASVTNSGKWSLKVNELCLEMDENSRQTHVDSIEIEGASETQQKEFMENANEGIPELLEELEVFFENIQSSIDIESVSKTEMSINLQGDTVIFKKIK